MRVLITLLLLVVTGAGCSDVTGPRVRPLVVLVFDDNAQGVSEHAFPRMSSRGMVGTVFVHTCSIGHSSYMGIDDLEVLRNGGWEVGAHTMTHPDLTRMTSEEIREEALGSRQVLERHGFPCRSFAVPYGLVNQKVREVVEPLFDIVRYSDDRPVRRPVNWHYLGMYALHSGESPRFAMGRLDRAVRRCEDLVVLGFHSISVQGGDCAASYPCYDAADFETILDHIEHLGLPTATLTEARGAIG
jgi:peptidoglycan/xylan/chitin deacetylase (PgdA/CDA1 family)